MSKTIYSQQQMELLKMNQYVQDCSQKYITFTDTCKIDTLKLDEKWEYYKDIFRGLWFPDFFIDSGAAKRTLGNWRHSLKMKWLPGMIGTKKWRKKTEKIDVSNMSKDEYITYLEAKTACLEELNRRILWHDP
jgi:putative transposase